MAGPGYGLRTLSAAVATAPHPRKGERLVLVTQKKGAARSEFQAFTKPKGASDLMVPAKVVFLEKVPVLGTGKIDMVGVAKLKDRAASAPAVTSEETAVA